MGSNGSEYRLRPKQRHTHTHISEKWVAKVAKVASTVYPVICMKTEQLSIVSIAVALNYRSLKGGKKCKITGKWNIVIH